MSKTGPLSSNDENWADFGQFMNQEESKSTNKNTLETVNDPWQSETSNSSTEQNKTESNTIVQQESAESNQNWANFDNFS